MIGPFEVELKIRLTDGTRTAVSTYDLPVGVVPTRETIKKAMDALLANAQEQLGPEWRLQNRHEFENEVVSERHGGMMPEFATKEEWEEE